MLQSSLVLGLPQLLYQFFLEVGDIHLIELFNSHLILSDPHIKESTKLKAPAYTFGGRFKSTSDKVTPSPNSYNTTGLTKKGRKM